MFEARGPNDTWHYKSQYYALLKSHDKVYQAPRVRCIFFDYQTNDWCFECDQTTFIGVGVFTGAALIDKEGETFADYDFKNLIYVCAGDVLRLTVRIRTGKQMVLEDAVEMYRRKENADPSFWPSKESWKRYCGGIRHDISEIQQQGEESNEGRICR